MGNIFLGFSNLDSKQHAALMKYAGKQGITHHTGELVPGKKQDKTKTNDDGNTGTDQKITPRMINTAAKAYVAKFSADAKKQVLNEFGATTVEGVNGLAAKDYPQVLAIFKSLEPHGADVLAGFQDVDPDPATAKKNKGGKNKKKKGGKDKKKKGGKNKAA